MEAARTRRGARRTGRAGVALCAALLALGVAAPRHEKRLEVAVDTPVYRLPPDLPLPAGEQRYRLHWSGLPVAQVQVAMAPDAERGGVAVEVLGATHPVIDWLYRYRFAGRGLVHTAPFAPGGFVVEACEKGRPERTEIRFGEPGHGVRGIRVKKGRVKHYVFHSDNTLDVPSSVYLVLNLDYAPGARFAVDAFTGRSRYLVQAEVQAREPVKLAGALHDAWRLRLTTEALTGDDPDRRHRETFVWVSDARPRRLLRASSRTFVGSIELELLPADAPREPIDAPRCA